MKLVSFVLGCLLTTSVLAAEAKSNSPAPAREPAQEEAIASTSAADSLGAAWKILKKNTKVAPLIKRVRDEQKECGGALFPANEKLAMNVYSGKGGAGRHTTIYLLPIYGGCAGTGMIEQVVLLAKIVNYLDMTGEEEKNTYSFFGFTRVNTLKAAEGNQAPFLD